MRAFAHWIITLCATPAGVIVSPRSRLPPCSSHCRSASTRVILLAAVALALVDRAAAGFCRIIAGAAVTFWMGVKIGEQGSSDGSRRNG